MALYRSAKKVGDVLDHWLLDRPTDSPGRYLRSALLDLRRARNSETEQVDDVLVFEERHSDLPWFPGDTALPPCEDLALSLLFSEKPLRVVSSGTGSGKSSVVSFLAGLFRALSREKRIPRNNLLIIDLQTLDPTKYWDLCDTRKEKEKIRQAFLIAVAHVLDARLKSRFGSALLVDSFLGLFPQKKNRSPTPAHFKNGIVDQFQDKLGRIIGTKQIPADLDWSELSQELLPVAKARANHLHKGLAPHDHLQLRILVMQELAFRLSDADSMPTSLVLDNVDNFPEFLQRTLVRSLATSTAPGCYMNDRVVNPPFSLTIFVRLSTAENIAHSFGQYSSIEPYPAPNPTDIVFLQLTKHLWLPDRPDLLKRLDPADRKQLLARAWYLWRSLAVPSPLERILSARSGTNIRNALLYARRWLLSPRIQQCPPPRRDYQRQIKTVLLAAVVIQRFEAAARWSFETERVNRTPGESRVALAERLLESFLDSLAKAGTFGDSETYAQAEDFRHRLHAVCGTNQGSGLLSQKFQKVRATCLSILVDGLAQHFGKRKLTPTEVRRAFERAKASFKPDADSWRQWLFGPLLDRLMESDLRGSRRSQTESSERIRQRRPGIEKVLKPLLSTTKRRLRTQEALPSNWLGASVLIAPDEAIGPHSTSATNLFTVSGETLLEIPLVVLAILAEAKTQVYTGTLKRELRERGFTDHSQVIAALMELVRFDQRLIYSGVRDDRDGVERWWSGGANKVSPSAAGTRFIFTLTYFPAYVQWCLLGIGEFRRSLEITEAWHRRTTALGRIDRVRQVFEQALDRERERTRPRVERGTLHLAEEDGIRNSLMPISWCYFNCLPSFLEDIGRSRARPRHIKRVAKDWLRLAEPIQAFYQEELEIELPPSWEEDLGFAKMKARRLRGS